MPPPPTPQSGLLFEQTVTRLPEGSSAVRRLTMETFRREKENRKNRGSALILVIVCMVFAGILGTSVLAASITNRDMKLVDERAKENFYSPSSSTCTAGMPSLPLRSS